MSNVNQTVGLLSVGAMALVLLGVGCMMQPQETEDTFPMMEDSADTMMKGDDMNEDENMVGGDAMIDAEGEVMLGDDDAMMEGDIEAEGDSMMEQSSAGTFEAYSADKLSRANDGTVVLAFLADWCPTCRAFKSDTMESLDDIPTGVSILEVNYDNATELRQRYGVTVQHTFIQVDAEGNMLQKWSGGNTLETVTERVS